jgi:hypothetical protein
MVEQVRCSITMTIPRLTSAVSDRLKTRVAARRAFKLLCVAVLAGFALLGATASAHADTTSAPRPVHWRLIYTGGPFSPVSVVWTTSSPIPRTEHGRKIDAGVGVKGPPAITVSSYGRCYQGLASSSVVKHLHVGRRYKVTIAIGHGADERRFTREVTLRRASLRGTGRHLHCR